MDPVSDNLMNEALRQLVVDFTDLASAATAMSLVLTNDPKMPDIQCVGVASAFTKAAQLVETARKQADMQAMRTAMQDAMARASLNPDTGWSTDQISGAKIPTTPRPDRAWSIGDASPAPSLPPALPRPVMVGGEFQLMDRSE